MSGAIAFQNIPPNLRVPLFYAEFDPSQAAASQPVQRTLIVGQATAAVPATPVPTFVPSVAWAQQTFGASSQIANMIAAYRANDTVGEIWALPLADAATATAASGSIAITGTATANGTLALYVAGVKVPVGVASGQTAAQVATAVAAAVTAAISSTALDAQTYLPVSAAAVSGTVTLTAANKGTLGNGIGIALNLLGSRGGEATPAGLSVVVTAMAGGATDPTLTSIATWLSTQAFDFILQPYSDTTSIGAFTAMMNDASGRWSYAQQIYGHVFTAKADTVANLLTLGAGLNDQHCTVLGINPLSPSPAWMRLAARVGSIVPSLKAQPNRPLQTLRAFGVLGETSAQDIGFSNQQALLSAGIALDGPGPNGPQCVRMVTTYQKNSYGVADSSYLDAETMYLIMAVTRHLKATVTSQLPRALLADDGTRLAPTPTGTTPLVVTPSIVKALLIADYRVMEALSWVERDDLFSSGLVVQRNSQDASRLDVLFDPYFIGGLRVFATLTQFHLQAQASEG